MSMKQRSPSLQIKNLLCNDLESNTKIPFIQLPHPIQKKSNFRQENHYLHSFSLNKNKLYKPSRFNLYQYQYQCHQNNTDILKIKRRRATVLQTQELQKVFEKTAFPSTGLRENLARHLGMSPRTVQIWFQNKRQAARRVYN